MSAKINKLSGKQWQLIAALKNRYLEIGLNCDPLDRSMVRTIIAEFYKRLKINPPLVFFVDSPLNCVLAYALLKNMLRGQLSDQLHGQLYNYFAGQHWCYWQTFYEAGKIAGADYKPEYFSNLLAWISEAESCHWWFPYRGFVIASERHARVSFDDHNRLHNENDLAVRYPDGWGVAAIHGVRVPQHYVETPAEKIDPVELLKEPNAQVRMAIIGKVGFYRLIRHLKTEEISRSPTGNKLITIDLGGQTIRALHLTWEERDGLHETVLPVPSRRDQFGADCPNNIDDFEQVRRWTLGWDMNVNIMAES